MTLTLRTVVAGLPAAVSFLGFVTLLVFHGLFGNPFPFSDDWGFVPYAVGAEPLTLDWLLAQHTDHRIPLSKLYHVLLLRLAYLDFRVVVLANVLLIYLTSRRVIAAVRAGRGAPHPGDLVVPLILLNPGFAMFLWGFQFQFVSSTLLLLLFASFFAGPEGSASPRAYFAAGACALLLGLCGMNGVVASLVVSVGLAALVVWMPPLTGWRRGALLALLAASAALALAMLVAWRPSGAASLPEVSSLGGVARLLGQLLRLASPLPFLSPFGEAAEVIVNTALYVLAFGLAAREAWRSFTRTGSISVRSVALPFGLLGGLATLAAIAAGRTTVQSRATDLHYGYLGVVLLIVAWMIVSLCGSRGVRAATAVVLVGLAGASFVANWQMRWMSAGAARARSVAIDADLASGMSMREFARRHVSDVYYVDTERAREKIVEGLGLLRRAGIQPYARLAPE